MPWSGKELVRLLEKNDWTLDRINGSHHIMKKSGFRNISVPCHGSREVAIGTAAGILRQAGIKEN